MELTEEFAKENIISDRAEDIEREGNGAVSFQLEMRDPLYAKLIGMGESEFAGKASEGFYVNAFFVCNKRAGRLTAVCDDPSYRRISECEITGAGKDYIIGLIR